MYCCPKHETNKKVYVCTHMPIRVQSLSYAPCTSVNDKNEHKNILDLDNHVINLMYLYS